ncbi:hypothetical protein [Thermococcus sp. 21S7]|uniref:hypothetical protein n=1 Tax=Thermococcus sp. 21S7 TaxID=1638221 RepID=UPI00143A9514|nr:hypothetical protein [Thermococcus sp. 21S7]NJE60759.1 hypothetical protein [Thermococcus sp. 21S7]
MDRRMLALVIILLIAVGAGAAYLRGKGGSTDTPVNYKAKILSRLGALNCYSYEERISLVRGNISVNSTIDGGYFNGTYFFHGKKDGVEWWTVLTGDSLVQRIIINGSEKTVTMNVSEAERSVLTSYDPVKFALRAVGTGMEIGGDELSRTYRYTVRLFPGKDDTMMSGNVTIMIGEDFSPKEIRIIGKVIDPLGKSEIRKLNAKLSGSCQIPGWVQELMKKKGG